MCRLLFCSRHQAKPKNKNEVNNTVDTVAILIADLETLQCVIQCVLKVPLFKVYELITSDYWNF